MRSILLILSVAVAGHQLASANTESFGEMQAVFEQACVATDAQPAKVAAIATANGWKIVPRESGDRAASHGGDGPDTTWLVNEKTDLRLSSGKGPMDGGEFGTQYAEACAVLVGGDFGVQAIDYAKRKMGRSADSESVDDDVRSLVWMEMLAGGSRVLGIRLAGDAETQLSLITIRAGSGGAGSADPEGFRMLVDLYEAACLATNAESDRLRILAKKNKWSPVTGADLSEIGPAAGSSAKFQAWWIKQDDIRLRVGLREIDAPAENGQMLTVTSCMTFASGDFSAALVDYLTHKLDRAPDPGTPGGEFDSLWLEPVGDVLYVHGVRAVQGAQGPIAIATYATLRPKP